MATLIIRDNCMTPDKYIELNFEIPNPFKFYKTSLNLFKMFFEARGMDIWEREFRWDDTSDPHEFLSKVFVRKSRDQYTYWRAEIFFHGYQPSDPNRIGRLRIKIGFILVTRFPEDSFIQKTPIYKALRWFYIYYFYQKWRQQQLVFCRNQMLGLRNLFLKLAGMAKEAGIE
mgnify:CR=1 FL=1